MRLADAEAEADLREVTRKGVDGSDVTHQLLYFEPAPDLPVGIAIAWSEEDAAAIEKRIGRPVWIASGDFPETLTLHPSVHAVGRNGTTLWHGWVRDGVLVSA